MNRNILHAAKNALGMHSLPFNHLAKNIYDNPRNAGNAGKAYTRMYQMTLSEHQN